MTFPGGGETVGEAYIRIIADGSRLGRSIRDEFAHHDDSFREFGHEDNKNYQRGWDDEMHRRPLWLRSVQDMRRSRARWEAVGHYLGGAVGENLRKSIIEQAGSDEIGNRIFTRLREQSQRAGNFAPFTRGMKNFGAEISRTVADIERDENHLGRLQEQAQRDDHVRTLRRLRDIDNLAHRLKDMGGEVQRAFSKLSPSVGARTEKEFESNIDRLVARAHDGNLNVLHDLRVIEDRTTDFIRAGELGFLTLNGRTRASVREMTNFERRIQSVHNRVARFDLGRLFGKGNRNDFINALGRTVGWLAEMGVRLAMMPIERFARLRGDLSAARGPAAKLEVLINRIGGALFGGVRLAGMFFAGVGALNLVLGPLAALVSMLAGAIVALAGSIVLGLLGAIGAALPLLGTLGATVGILSLAFLKMDKDTKKALSVQLKPVTSQLKELQKVARAGLFSDLDKQIPIMRKVVAEFEPFTRQVSRAIARTATDFLRSLDSKEFRNNLNAMTRFFPGAIQRLGKITSNVFGGIAGTLRALVPVAERFLDSLVKGSARFFKFANSVHGQNSIRVFFDRGYDSAQKLWALVRSLTRVLGTLFKGGQDTGDNLIVSMIRNLDRFNTYLTSGPGRAAMANFFADVERFWGFLGRAFGGLGRLFGGLDSSESRGALNTILTLVGEVSDIVADVLPAVAGLQHQFFAIVGDVATAALDALRPLVPLFQDIVRDVADTLIPILRVGADLLITVIIKPLGDLARFISRNSAIFQPLIVGLLLLWGAFKAWTIIHTVSAALGTFFTALPGLVGGATSRATGLLGGFVTTLQTTAGRVSTLVTSLGTGVIGQQIQQNATSTGGKILGALTQIGSGALGGAAIGSFFGPVGTAVGGVTGALVGGASSLVTALRGTKKQTDDTAAVMIERFNDVQSNIQALTNSITGDNGLFGALTKQSLGEQLQKGGGITAALQLGIDPKTVLAAIQGSQAAVSQVFAAASKDANGSGKVLLDLFAKLSGEYQDASVNADQLAVAQGRLNLATRNVYEQTAKFSTSLRDTDAKGQLNIQWVKAHVEAINADAVAQLKQGKSAADVATSVERQVGAFKRGAEKAGFNRDRLLELIGTYGKLPKSVITELIKRGVVPADIQAIIDRYRRVPPEVVTQLRKYGVSAADIQSIVDRYGRIPPDVLTLLRKKGVTPDEIQRIIDKYNRIPPYKQTILETIYKSSVWGGTKGGDPRLRGASGMIVTQATRLLAGEAGPEAIVPLNRPLSQVDPSVKALSAFAQGIPLDGINERRMASGGVVVPSRAVTVAPGAIVVATPTTNPRAVAVEVLNEFVARVNI